MPRRLKTIAATAVLFCAGGTVWAQPELRAGGAKSVVTPDLRTAKVYIAGFGNNRVATGVHDDLYVRCVALAAGGQTLLLCSADVIGLFYEDVLKIRQEVRIQAPEITHLVIASTHVHEGPDTLGLWGPTPLETGVDRNYLNRLDSTIAATAARAAHSMEPARLTLARDDHPLLASLQSVDRPPIVKDPYLFVMRLTSVATGKTISTVVNWSDHPETLGGKNTKITADYPHWVCQYVENHLGGTAAFFSGSIGKVSTLGNQVAVTDPDTGEVAHDGTWRKAELIGTMIGELALRALESAELAPISAIRIRQGKLFVPLQNDHFRIAEAAGVFAGRRPLYTNGSVDTSTVEKEIPGAGRVQFPTGRDVETEVDYIQLRSGERIAAEMATVPGEIYPELTNGGMTRYPGADFPDAPFEPTLRAHLKAKYQFIFGLANDELGYLIPKSEWDERPPWLRNAQHPWYGEINSVGPDAAGVILGHLTELIDKK